MIATRIKELCKREKVSIHALEKAVGLGNGSISRWDHSEPGVMKLKAVADYFGVTVDYLIT